MRRLPLTLAIAAVLLAVPAPGSAASPPPSVKVLGEPTQLTQAASGVDKCGRPDDESLTANEFPSITQAPDGLVATWFSNYGSPEFSNPAALVGPSGQVQPLDTSAFLDCTEGDDGRFLLLPTVETDSAGRTYLASVIFEPVVPAVGVGFGLATTQRLQVAVRDPGSDTFSPPVTVSTVNFVRTVDVAADPSTPGRVWIIWADPIGPIGTEFVALRLRISRTDDGGATWSTPTTIATGVTAVEAPFAPKMVVFDEDRLVVAFTGRRDRAAGPASQLDVLAYRSDDAGATWSGPVRVLRVSGDQPRDQSTGESLRNFPPPVALAAAEDGTLHLAVDEYSVDGGAALLTARSADGGATWVPGPDLVRTELEGGFFTLDLAAGPDGELVAGWVAFDDTPERLEQQSFVAVTTSEQLAAGGRWSEPVAVGPATDRRAARTAPSIVEGIELTRTPTGFAVAYPITAPDAAGQDYQLLLSRLSIRPVH